MNNTVELVASLEQMKTEASRRRERQREEAESRAMAEAARRRSEWEALVRQVEQDHPYFAGMVRGNLAHGGDGHARLEVAPAGSEAVEFAYERNINKARQAGPWVEAGLWVQVVIPVRGAGTFNLRRYAVRGGWVPDASAEEGVSSSRTGRTDDLGEALLLAEESHKEKGLLVKEALRERDRHFAETRRKAVREPSAEECLIFSLRNAMTEWREQDEAANDVTF